jgi:hypothetical protein
VELIRGGMLRNASCEGVWDASKDDLSTALPLSSSKSAHDLNREMKGGDEEWLSKLASLVGIDVNKTTKKEKEAPKKEGSEKDPSDFFDNLLKK